MTGTYLGIDGGGTKTRAVILDAFGRLIGEGVGESSNFGYIGVEQATSNIRDAIISAASQAGIVQPRFDAAFFGLAGVVSDTDREMARNMARSLDLVPGDQIGVDHDCRIALAGGLGGETGIVQIIGTGTSTFGMNASGDRWMSGGWGRLIADEGGGYWLGIEAMKATTAAYDGRGHPTLLHNRVLDALGINSVGDIMQVLYTQQMPVADIAALGRLVIEAASEKDAVAIGIIAHGMDEVARCVEAVANELQFPADHIRLITVGGITQAGDVVMEPLQAAVHARVPTCQITPPLFDAGIGAGLLAMQHHGQAMTPKILENLRSSLNER